MTGVFGQAAYFLVIHGSSDPRPHQAAIDLKQQVAQQLGNLNSDPPVQAGPLIQVGSLECGDRPLAEQLVDFSTQARQAGKRQVRVLPLFLLPGVHVMEDIPAQIAIAQQTLQQSAENSLALDLLPHLGARANWFKAIAPLVNDPQIEQWILLAHGSRRPGGNQPIVNLAQDMGMTPAFWSVDPKLAEQIEVMVAAGKTHLGIQPLLLFAGSLMDGIAEQVTALKQQYPRLHLQLNAPIGTHPQLIEQITHLLLA